MEEDTITKRKVIQIGGMLVISLPAAVVRKYGIKRGDKVEFQDTLGGVLTIHPIAAPLFQEKQ